MDIAIEAEPTDTDDDDCPEPSGVLGFAAEEAEQNQTSRSWYQKLPTWVVFSAGCGSGAAAVLLVLGLFSVIP